MYLMKTSLYEIFTDLRLREVLLHEMCLENIHIQRIMWGFLFEDWLSSCEGLKFGQLKADLFNSPLW